MATKIDLATIRERNARRKQKDICGQNLWKRGRTATKIPDRSKICTKRAGDGTNHPGWGACASHGGLTPKGISEAALAESKYLQKTFATSFATDPAQALVDELARTHGSVVYLQLAIDIELREIEAKGWDPLDHLISPRMQLIRKMYDAERDRLTRLSTACMNLGIKERELRLMQQMGAMIQFVLEKTLSDLLLTPEQRDAAKGILAAHLQAAAHHVAADGHVVHAIPSKTG